LRAKKVTYKSTGIDMKKIIKAQNTIGRIISTSRSFLTHGRVLSGFGHYAGLIEIDGKIFALHTDGVGTKIIVSQMMNRFDTIGIDCVAMNVNDIICVGAKPVGFIDYIAITDPDSVLLGDIVKGLVRGAKDASVPIVGGETAVIPELLSKGSQKKAFDLVGMAFGIIPEKNKIIMGSKIKKGDIIIGIASSGLHSNGYTLARRVLLSKHSLSDCVGETNQTIGEMILAPTRIYVRPIVTLIENDNIPIHGLLHVTGGSFTKFSRLNNRVNYRLDSLPVPTDIFKLIQKEGHIRIKEMYKTFNMGIGFCLVIPGSSVDNAIETIERYGMSCSCIGRIIGPGSGNIQIKTGGRTFTL
jgi:phosphoribosylformylglycinamidine cyclo-ligase